ncbi:MAG: hypothetical protein EXQ47_02270 [Bryobacterales bacterium]|nr:hypothetical protein [Bryobacterales bacterium]
MKPREIVEQIETNPALPTGHGDRFAGYAVLGLPFRSGHVLALRRFPASSVGPGYTSVWHRDPRGAWTFYSTVNPDLGCSRYFGGEVTRNVVGPIEIEWTAPAQFTVNIESALRWNVRLRASWSTRLLNAAARLAPDSWWQEPFILKAMGAAARFALGTGKLNLAGETPNGQEFIANPRRLWLIESSQATVKGQDLGPVGALAQQARLNDFLIPQKGLFAVARAFLRPRHQT